MPAILAAQEATSTIPIVMVAADPVGTGLVTTLARPGGNITGLSILGPRLEGKRLELLKAALPRITRVGFLWDPTNTAMQLRFREAQAAAKALGIELQSVEVRQPDELPKAFAAMTKERVRAVLVPSAFAGLHRRQIAEIATRNRLPVMYDAREYMDAEGLMSYGPDISHLYRRAASYVDKILKGAKPSDLPIEQPTKFDLVINLKTAKALGLTIPPALLNRADEVIQ
jgi:putative ABC transport system substrate-binding protein